MPMSSQFSVLTLRSFMGMRLRSVHPPVSASCVWASMHSSPRELSMVKEPLVEVIFSNNSFDSAISMEL